MKYLGTSLIMTRALLRLIISIPYIPKKVIIDKNSSMLSCLRPNGLLLI